MWELDEVEVCYTTWIDWLRNYPPDLLEELLDFREALDMPLTDYVRGVFSFIRGKIHIFVDCIARSSLYEDEHRVPDLDSFLKNYIDRNNSTLIHELIHACGYTDEYTTRLMERATVRAWKWPEGWCYIDFDALHLLRID